MYIIYIYIYMCVCVCVNVSMFYNYGGEHIKNMHETLMQNQQLEKTINIVRAPDYTDKGIEDTS